MNFRENSIKPTEILTGNFWGYQYHISSQYNKFTVIHLELTISLNLYAMSLKLSGKRVAFILR